MKELTSGNVVKLQQGERIDGTFINIEPSAQYKDSYALKIQVGNDIKVIFVSNIVKDLITGNNIQQGKKISVLYKGLKSNKSGTAKYKDYTVFTE